jgi:hypothetical protein
LKTSAAQTIPAETAPTLSYLIFLVCGSLLRLSFEKSVLKQKQLKKSLSRTGLKRRIILVTLFLRINSREKIGRSLHTMLRFLSRFGWRLWSFRATQAMALLLAL